MIWRRPSEVRLLEDMAARRVATGIGSRALALTALRLPVQTRFPAYNKPADAADWQRCVDTYKRMPHHLQRRVWNMYRTWGTGLGFTVGPGPRSWWAVWPPPTDDVTL